MKRLLLVKLLIAGISMGISLAIAEVGLRLLVHADAPAGEGLRDPGRFADYYSDDDYWKLYYRWNSQFVPPKTPHPLLGWVWKVRGDFVDGKVAGSASRRPVVLYGDSFAACVKPARCFEDTLNADPEFNTHYFLLNHGTGGYGVDQIRLLMGETLDQYDNPIVIFSLMSFDLDRSVLSVRIGQKPYFDVVDGEVALRGVPIEPDPAGWFAAHPPEIRSYLWALLVHSKLMPAPLGGWLRGESGVRLRKREVNRAILADATEELRERGLDFFFLVFHPGPELNRPSWREGFLRRTFESLDVPVAFTSTLLQSSLAELSLDELIDPGNGHPTTRYNDVVAREIKRRVLLASDPQLQSP